MLDPTKAETYQQFRKPESSFHAAKCQKILQPITNRKSLTVVEVGSGTGIYTRYLLKEFGTVIATDIDEGMAVQAKQLHPEAEVIVADATRMPFQDSSVDAVAGISVLHHITDRQVVFNETARVLRPGGWAVFCEPNQYNPMTALVQAWYREPALTRSHLRRYAQRAGMRVVKLGTALLRSPSIAFITDRLPGFGLLERAAEAMHLGVSVYVVAQK